MNVHCVVYRSGRKVNTYLYLRSDLAPDDLPGAVREMLGVLHKVMDLELTAERRLAREDVQVVRANLAASGFHVQFPPDMVIAGG